MVPTIDSQAQVSRLGDVWQLGNHLLVCGDATKENVYRQSLNGRKARFVFADPAYNVKIAGNVSGLGAVKHREFQIGSGELTTEQFVGFLRAAFVLLVRHTMDGAIHAICMD